MQVRHVQNFPGAGIQVDGVEFRTVFSSRVQTANQLANPGTVQISYIPKIQKNPATAILEQIHQQSVNGFAFDQCETATNIDNRHIA